MEKIATTESKRGDEDMLRIRQRGTTFFLHFTKRRGTSHHTSRHSWIAGAALFARRLQIRIDFICIISQ